MTLRLRGSFAEHATKADRLTSSIANFASPLRACAATLRELREQPELPPKEALEQFAEEYDGNTSWLAHLSAAREQRPLQIEATNAAMKALLKTSERMRAEVGTSASSCMNPFDFTGPAFLAFFTLYGVLICVASALVQFRLERSNLPLPRLTDPYEIGYLRAGARGALQVALMALVNRNYFAWRTIVSLLNRPRILRPERHRWKMKFWIPRGQE